MAYTFLPWYVLSSTYVCACVLGVGKGKGGKGRGLWPCFLYGSRGGGVGLGGRNPPSALDYCRLALTI